MGGEQILPGAAGLFELAHGELHFAEAEAGFDRLRRIFVIFDERLIVVRSFLRIA